MNTTCNRKLRLFFCALLRLRWKKLDQYFRDLVVLNEEWLDGKINKKTYLRFNELLSPKLNSYNRELLRAVWIPLKAVNLEYEISTIQVEENIALLQYLLKIEPRVIEAHKQCILVARYHVSVTLLIASAAKDVYNRWEEIGILGDLIEETCLDHAECMIEHCRTKWHAKGCWVIDSILGYS